MTARHAASASGSRRPRLRGRRLARPGICLVAGVALWASFPPLDAWPLAMLAVAAFTLAVRDASVRATIAGGWLFGLGTFVPMLSFLRWIGVDAWLILAVGEALWFVLLALAVRWAQRAPLWPVAVALLWVGEEWLRDRVPFHGFPWGRLAFGQADGPLLPWAAIGGAVLVTFAAALLGALLAAVASSFRSSTSGRRRTAVVVAAVAVGGASIGGAAAVSVPTGGTTAGGPSHLTVAVVQGNVPRLGLEEFAQRRAVTANHVAETRRLAEEVAAGRLPRPDLVIWPENASDDDPFHDPVARSMIESAVQAIGVPVLVGAVLDGPGSHVRNAAIVWSPSTGPGQIYVKRHLVPFGEYIPGRSLLTHLGVGRFSLIPRDFAAGRRPGVLDVGPARVADVICFEVADDGIVRQAVTGGGRLITVQTNNATYERVGDSGDGGETAQQLQMSRLRAVEHGRAVLVAATSGVSAVIAPDGAVRQQSGVFTPALLVADVPLRDPRTVADRMGVWPEHGLALAGLVWLAAVVLRERRRRSEQPAGPVVDEPMLAGTP
jgi:apolipoprotein N-acyltransferase